MLISLNWLSAHCKFPNTEQLVNDLNRIGFEVEGVIEKGQNLSNIVIGQIIEFNKHPDADRLRIAKVDIKSDVIQIVTAAENVQLGDKIPVSLPGAQLANGLKIKKGKLRGVQSNGMMCSAVECGLTDTSPGVWVLPTSSIVGSDFIKAAELMDTVLDIAVLPNRGDALSLIGLAREVRALYGEFETKTIEPLQSDLKDDISCQARPEICRFYRAQKITGIKNRETPLHFQTKLYYSGYRPITWIVDVTNIVMVETGQPLHAFCSDNITDIKVEFSGNQSIQLLNEKTYQLTDRIAVVNLNGKTSAVAGIMGALNHDITEDTNDIILEAALFDAVLTRRASKILGLRSESSNRFEKYVDSSRVNLAVARVHQLLSEFDNIKVYQPNTTGSLAEKTTTIPIDLNQLNDFLGTHFNWDNIQHQLKPLGFLMNNHVIEVPSWRAKDCTEWPDIAEEMCRFSGIEGVGTTAIIEDVTINHDANWIKRNGIQKAAIQFGLTEVVPFPLCENDMNKSQPKILNPITPELTQLRSNAAISLVNIASLNASRHQSPCRIFSIGPVWSDTKNEATHFSALLQGPQHHSPYLPEHSKHVDFFELKGLLDQLLTNQDYNLEKSNTDLYHPGQSASIILDNKSIGTIGMLHPNIEKNYRIQTSGIIEFNLDAILNQKYKMNYELISKYPSTSRDVTYIMSKSSGTLEDVLNILNSNKPSICQSIELCGYFQKKNNDDINISFRMIYRDNNRSLEMDEVNNVHKSFAEAVIHKLPCRFP